MIKEVLISSKSYNYKYIPKGDGTGTLLSNRIVSFKGVEGVFLEEPMSGSSVVFIVTEPCILRNNESMTEVDAMSGILISHITDVCNIYGGDIK